MWLVLLLRHSCLIAKNAIALRPMVLGGIFSILCLDRVPVFTFLLHRNLIETFLSELIDPSLEVARLLIQAASILLLYLTFMVDIRSHNSLWGMERYSSRLSSNSSCMDVESLSLEVTWIMSSLYCQSLTSQSYDLNPFSLRWRRIKVLG